MRSGFSIIGLCYLLLVNSVLYAGEKYDEISGLPKFIQFTGRNILSGLKDRSVSITAAGSLYTGNADDPLYFQTNMGLAGELNHILTTINEVELKPYGIKLYLRLIYLGDRRIVEKPVIYSSAIDHNKPINSYQPYPDDDKLLAAYNQYKQQSAHLIADPAGAVVIDVLAFTQRRISEDGSRKGLPVVIMYSPWQKIEIGSMAAVSLGKLTEEEKYKVKIKAIADETERYQLAANSFFEFKQFKERTESYIRLISGLVTGRVKPGKALELPYSIAWEKMNDHETPREWWKLLSDTYYKKTITLADGTTIDQPYVYSMHQGKSQLFTGANKEVPAHPDFYIMVGSHFGMSNEELAIIENNIKELSKTFPYIVRIHLGKDKLSYDFITSNPLLDKYCHAVKVGWLMANAAPYKIEDELDGYFSLILNEIFNSNGVPLHVTPPAPDDYLKRAQKDPWLGFLGRLPKVPTIPEHYYNCGAPDYDDLLPRVFIKANDIASDALNELIFLFTDIDPKVQFPLDNEQAKLEMAFICGFINGIPEMINAVTGLPKVAGSVHEVLCDKQKLEAMVAILHKFNEAARQMGGYKNMLSYVWDQVHVNPCMKAYYAGSAFSFLATIYLSWAAKGTEIASLAGFIEKLGNIDPVGFLVSTVFSPMGKFAKYAYTITTTAGKEIVPGIWSFGKHLIKVAQGARKGTITLYFIEKQLYEIKQGHEVIWKEIKELINELLKDLAPGEARSAVMPDGRIVPIAYLSENQGDGNGGGNTKPGKVIQLIPEKNPDGSAPDEQIAIVQNEGGEEQVGVIRKEEKVAVPVKKTEWVEVAEESKKEMGSVEPAVTLRLMKDGKLVGTLERELTTVANGDPIVRYYFADLKGNKIGSASFRIQKSGRQNVLRGRAFYEEDDMEAELPGVIGIALQEADALLKAKPDALSKTPGFNRILLVVDEDLVNASPSFRKERDFLTNEDDERGPISESLKENYEKGEVEEGDEEGLEWWVYEKRKDEEMLQAVRPGTRRKVLIQDPSVIGNEGAEHLITLLDAETKRVVGQIRRRIRVRADILGTTSALEYHFIDAEGVFGIKGRSIDLKTLLMLLPNEVKEEYKLGKALHVFAADMNFPKELTEQYAGIGGVVFEDGYKFYNKKMIVDVILASWEKNPKYVGYEGQSINLTAYVEGLTTLGSKEKAAANTPTGKWINTILDQEKEPYIIKVVDEKTNKKGELQKVVALFIKNEERAVASVRLWVRPEERFTSNVSSIKLEFIERGLSGLLNEEKVFGGTLTKTVASDPLTYFYTYVGPQGVRKKMEVRLIENGTAKGTLTIKGTIEAEVDGLNTILIDDAFSNYKTENAIERIEVSFSKNSTDWYDGLLYNDAIINSTATSGYLEDKGFVLDPASIKDYPDYVTAQFIRGKIETKPSPYLEREGGQGGANIINVGGKKQVSIAESDRKKIASKEVGVDVPVYTKDGQVPGSLGRIYYNGEVSYYYKSKKLETSNVSDASVKYYTPTAIGALPNKGEGYLLITFRYQNPGIREEISLLEPEIIDNILKIFSVKKTDNLFLYWPEGHTDFQKAQQEVVAKVLAEKYGYNSPETRSVDGKEYLVFTRPPAAPVNVKRLDFSNMGSLGAGEILLGNKSNEPMLKISKIPVRQNANNLTFSYTDLRIEEKIIDQRIGYQSYSTHIYSFPGYNISPLGINKQINVMSIELDGMPARIEQELSGTMREVRSEALAYYNKNFGTIEGVICELKITREGVKPYDMIVYETAYEKTGSVEKAIEAMPTAQWAYANGFPRAVIITHDPNGKLLYVLFTKEEVAGRHGFSLDKSGNGGNGNVTPGNTGSSAGNNENAGLFAPDQVTGNNNNGSLSLKNNEFADNAPIGSREKEVHLPLADGTGEILRRRINDGPANACSYGFNAKETGDNLFPEVNNERSLAMAQIDFKYDIVNKGDLKFLAIRYYPTDKVERLRIAILKDALAYYKSENIAGVKIIADNWTAEITDLEILQSDIGKIISKEFPEITIKKDENKPVVIFSKGELKRRIEIVVADIPEVLTTGTYNLPVKSKGTDATIALLRVEYSETIARSFNYSLYDAVELKKFEDIGNAAIGFDSQAEPVLNFLFTVDPAIGSYALELHLFDKAFTRFTSDGIAFKEVRVTWKKGFADPNDSKAFQGAVKYGVNSAIFKTAVGAKALEKGYTEAIVRVNEDGSIGARFIKPAIAN